MAAVSVAGPSERMPRQLVGSEMAARVVAAADAISLRLGHAPVSVEAGGLKTSARSG